MPTPNSTSRFSTYSPLADQSLTDSGVCQFQSRDKTKWIWLSFGLAVVFAVASAAVLVGTYEISLMDVWRVLSAHLSGGDTDSLDKLLNTIIWEIRLPRILAVVLVGMALSSSGAVYQGAFGNPLVEPYILGVSAGASLGAALAIVYPGLFFSVHVGAFVFGLAAVGITSLAGTVRGRPRGVTLILAGVIVSALFQSAVSILKYLADDKALRALVFWTMGGFYYATWSDVVILAPLVLISVFWLWRMGWRLNVLSLGNAQARSLGVHPERLRLALIVLATLLTSAAVSTSGIIAWVGLMTPHAARMLLGPDNRFVIPGSGLIAAGYLLICDTLARALTTAEIPVSIITSILGAPYLFYLLRTKSRYLNGN